MSRTGTGRIDIKICVTCNEPFARKSKVCQKQWATTKYCSNACLTQRHREPRELPTHVCKFCGTDFVRYASTKYPPKFCSMVCKAEAQNQGLSSENELARHSTAMAIWRKAVFERDNYTCQDCGSRGGSLHAHHIKPFSLYPDLRYTVSNGMTLCISCHTETPTYGGKMRNYNG